MNKPQRGAPRRCIQRVAFPFVAAIAEILEDGVPVHRDVVHLHQHAVLAEHVEDAPTLAVGHSDGVEVPHRIDVGMSGRQCQQVQVGQPLPVSLEDSGALALELIEPSNLVDPQRAQHVGEAVVQPEGLDLLVPRPLVRIALLGPIADHAVGAEATGALDEGRVR